MNPNCHHPPYTASFDPAGGELITSVSDAMIDRIIEQIERREGEDLHKPLAAIGATVQVDVVECSWCRRPYGEETST